MGGGGRQRDNNKDSSSIGGSTTASPTINTSSRLRNSDTRSLSSYDSGSGSSGGSESEPVKWALPLVHTEVTEPQNMDEEIKRSKALNNYFILDAGGEVKFDRITTMASQIFDVPTYRHTDV
jgi:hypothetical protein